MTKNYRFPLQFYTFLVWGPPPHKWKPLRDRRLNIPHSRPLGNTVIGLVPGMKFLTLTINLIVTSELVSS